MSIRHFAAPLLAIVIALCVAGCMSREIEESRRQIEAQQALIEKQGRDIQQLQTLQAATQRTPVAALGTCDPSVRDLATRKGGERFAANDFQQALGFYEDALVACPNSARAELNVARTYQAIGNRSLAIDHYQHAARATDSSDPDASAQARAALVRLGSPER
ncbi:MAG: hypothetical protein ACREQF_03390 [Candidatus Binataceae bacterium]